MVDPTSNFILSGSSDASIHVWSLVNILSFTKPPSGQDQQQPNSPIRTFSNHRAAITSLAVGHSTSRYNIAVSTSKDSIANVWDYRTGRILRTYLLPSAATCVALDPVDRAFYVGYEDGSIQGIDFYKNQTTQHPLHDPSLQSTPAQLSAEDRWLPPSADLGGVATVTVSYDGATLLSGHGGGKVLSWNVGRRKYASTIADYTHPITNLQMLPPNGLPHPSLDLKRVSHTIVKPRYDHGLSDGPHTPGAVPGDYTFNTHILPPGRTSRERKPDQFTEALTHAFFPQSMMEEGLAELAAFGQPGSNAQAAAAADTAVDTSQIADLESEITTLRKKASINEAARQATTDEMVKLRSDVMNLKNYVNQLHGKQEQSHRERVQRQARKEQRETRRREAWFAAEKKGKNGDAVIRDMEREEEAMTSETDEQNDDE